MQLSETRVATPHAASYLSKLCAHWSHRFAVERGEATGTIQLPHAVCALRAHADTLRIRLEIEEGEDQGRMEEIVQGHIERFAFQEELRFLWERSESTLAAV